MTLDLERKSIDAVVEDSDTGKPHGGFTAVLSTPSLDRDGDVLSREEWVEPLPGRLPLDIDHNMTVEGTIGSFRPYFDDEGRLMMDATFASTPKAQEVRTLIKEGHISSVSVAFMTDRSKKDGTPRRELLNAGVVAIPSNRDAIIFDAKAATYAPPKAVQSEAKRALAWIKEGHAGQGFTDTGRKRAADLAAGRSVGRDTIGRIANFLARHEGDKQGKGWSPGEDGYPSPGRVAWAAWGGDPAKSWTASILKSDEGKAATADEDIMDESFDSKAADCQCWEGYERVPGTTPCAPGSCRKCDAAAKDLEAEVTTKANGDMALIQAIHDASCHMGAMCCESADDEMAEMDEMANDKPKSVKGVDLPFSVGITLDQFKVALNEITTSYKVSDTSDDSEPAAADEPQGNSPADPPADTAEETATDSVPVDLPVDAAGDAAESEVVLSSEKRARNLAMAIFSQEVLSD